MATYAIGDIQGCYSAFMALLRDIDFSPSRDQLWLTGDLVNRGPDSLSVLRWVFRHQDVVTTVLGNHDLHLLAVAEGYGRILPDDTLLDILNAPDGKLLLPHTGKGANSLDDAVDEVIEMVMLSGGEVHYYPAGDLEAHQRIAGIAPRAAPAQHEQLPELIAKERAAVLAARREVERECR